MIIRGFITAILTLALTLVSFVHGSLSPETEAQAETYILAGGDWAELCGDGTDPLVHVTKCMACLIGQTCALPDASDIARPAETGTLLNWTIVQENNAKPAAHRAHSARAPPLRLV